MTEPVFGYISSDINHLTSISILVVIPLVILGGLIYWYKKKKKSVTENAQSKWHLVPVILAICLWLPVAGFSNLKYGSMLWHKERCHHFYPDLIRGGATGIHDPSSLFYDFDARSDRSSWPFCPEDKEALLAYTKRHEENKARGVSKNNNEASED